MGRNIITLGTIKGLEFVKNLEKQEIDKLLSIDSLTPTRPNDSSHFL